MPTAPLAFFYLSRAGSLWIYATFGVGVGLYLFYRGFNSLQRKRLILNTPSSKIRSASIGLVEVSGLAVGPYTVQAPITGMPCYFYRTIAWQLKKSGKNTEWHKVAEENLHVPFFLDDNTAKVLVNPEGAELDVHRDFHEEYRTSVFGLVDSVPASVLSFLTRHGINNDSSLKVEEYCIKPKNALFVLGTLTENPGLNVNATPVMSSSSGHSFSLKLQGAISPEVAAAMETMPGVSVTKTLNFGFGSSTIEKKVIRLSTAGAGEVSGDLTQQGKIAAAMMKAGITNPAAWEAAGLQYPPAPPLVATATPSDAEGFDLSPPTVLMKGAKDPTFFISWHSQRDVLKTLGWKSVLMIWGGPLLTIAGLYILAAQLGWL